MFVVTLVRFLCGRVRFMWCALFSIGFSITQSCMTQIYLSMCSEAVASELSSNCNLRAWKALPSYVCSCMQQLQQQNFAIFVCV